METTIIQLLILSDITFTHYFFHLMKQKNCLDMKQERNWIPRMIMGNNPRPTTLLRGSIINLLLLTTIFIHSNTEFQYAMIGAWTMLNYGHLLQWIRIKEVWNNEKSWYYYKKMLEEERKKSPTPPK